MREAKHEAAEWLAGCVLLGLVSAFLSVLSAGRPLMWKRRDETGVGRARTAYSSSKAGPKPRKTDQRGNIGESERAGATFKAGHPSA